MEDNQDVVQDSTEPVVDNTYELKLTVLKNDLITLTIKSSTLSSKWFNVVLGTFGVLILVGAFGDKFVNLYHQLIK